MSSVLRGGRLASRRKDVVAFISSTLDDVRIAQQILLINEAHAIALAKSKAISRRSAHRILVALRKIEKSIPHKEGVEDLHVLIEEHVTRQVGTVVGGQMHFGKSRNDQVATAIRMRLREDLLEIFEILHSFESTLVRLAGKHAQTIFPGYTHLQPAQPITFAHYLLANADSLLRDSKRILEDYQRINRCPMGGGALAGTTINLDREMVARLLGFDYVVENSLDAVGSRDFALEALSVFSFIALDLSRMAQDMIFYSAADVNLIEIPEEFTSTSSIMPQKKNPDPLEVLRARCSKVLGNYITGAMILERLPTGYNLDFQEFTPLIWSSADTIKSCLKLMSQLIPRIKVNPRIWERPQMAFVAATEVANILVKEEKMPFRTAHQLVGRAVRISIGSKKSLGDWSTEDWRRVAGKRFRHGTVRAIGSALDLRRHLRLYRSRGSPNPKEVKRMIRDRTRQLAGLARENVQIISRLRTRSSELRSSTRTI